MICREAQYIHWFPGVKSDRTLPQSVIETLGEGTDMAYISLPSQRDFSNRWASQLGIVSDSL